MAKKNKKKWVQGKADFKGFGPRETAIATTAHRLLKQIQQAPRETVKELQTLAQQHPDCVEVFDALAEAHVLLGNHEQYQATCERLAELQPGRADRQLHLAQSYLTNYRLVLGLLGLRQFQADFPSSSHAAEVQAMLTELEPHIEEILAGIGLADCDRREEVAALHERTLSALSRGQFAEACQHAEATLAIRPQFFTALNNLSLASWYQGHDERARECTEQALAIAPDDIHARADQIRYWALDGELERARTAAAELLELDSPKLERWSKTAEALAFLDQPELIITNYERAQAAGNEIKGSALLDHFTAFAYCKLGDTTRARQLWEAALSDDPTLRIARQNYDDLMLPASDRQGPWALRLEQWVPRLRLEALHNSTQQAIAERDLAEIDAADWETYLATVTQPYLEATNLLALAPRLLRHGGPDSRQFLIATANVTQNSDLWTSITDYALSDVGPDRPRVEAARAAVEYGALPSGTILLWIAGKQCEQILMSMKIDDKIAGDEHAPAVMQLLTDGLMKLQAGESEAARPLLREAQALEPDAPDLNYNLALTYLLGDRRDEGRARVEAVHARYPDYPMAAIQLARLHIEDGDLEAANAKLIPLLSRSRLHVEDFGHLCNAEAELAVARGNTEALRSWLSMWEQVNPDDPNLPVCKERLEITLADLDSQ